MLPVSPKPWCVTLPGEAVLCVCCRLPVSTPSTVLNSPCREKASWALSFHLCRPPPAPLLNEGHFKCCFSLIPPSCYCCRATPLLVLRLSNPPAQPLLSPQQVGGASCGFRTVASCLAKLLLSSQWNGVPASTTLLHHLCQQHPCPCVGRRNSRRAAPALASAYQRLVTVSKATGIAF